MENMTFTELQQRMQLEKKQERNAKYASRHAEDIYNTFKSLKSNWSVVVNYELVEFANKTFVKAIATASNREEKEQAVAFAELSPVPILKTRNGDLKQMTEPQWTGAVQSYAGKYALQSLFAIGDQDVDHFEVSDDSLRQNQTHNPQPHQNQQPQQTRYESRIDQQPNFISNEQHDTIMQLINELALITGQAVETVAKYYLGKYKLNDFHELLVPGFDVVTMDIQGQIYQRKGQNMKDVTNNFVFVTFKKSIFFSAVKYDLFVIFFHDYSSSPSLYFLNLRVRAVMPAAITTSPKVLAIPSFSPVTGRVPP